MKIQIRNNVFETNSSSTHAICITKKHIYPSDLPEVIVFKHDEFGWEVRKLKSCKKRASYLYEAICSSSNKYDRLETLEKILNSYGIKCEFESPGDEYCGYIDHGYDLYDFVEDLLSDEDKLMTYLFGDSFIVTGNDNSYGFSDIMYDHLEDEKTSYGTFPRYSDTYKDEFNGYDIYEKGN